MADYSKPKAATKPVATKSITRYLLVNRNDIGDFMKAVDISLAEGWQCQGGVSVIHWVGNYPGTRYHQAMIKVIDLASEGVADSTDVSNPQYQPNATLSNLEGRDGDSK